MTDCPTELLYTTTHEWIKKKNDTLFLGITEHAQAQLGDIVFIDLPEVDSSFSKGDEIAVIESVKTAADIYTPVTGDIIAINENLVSNPEHVNQDCYNQGWLLQIKITDSTELDDLLSSAEYQDTLEEE